MGISGWFETNSSRIFMRCSLLLLFFKGLGMGCWGICCCLLRRLSFCLCMDSNSISLLFESYLKLLLVCKMWAGILTFPNFLINSSLFCLTASIEFIDSISELVWSRGTYSAAGDSHFTFSSDMLVGSFGDSSSFISLNPPIPILLLPILDAKSFY